MVTYVQKASQLTELCNARENAHQGHRFLEEGNGIKESINVKLESSCIETKKKYTNRSYTWMGMNFTKESAVESLLNCIKTALTELQEVDIRYNFEANRYLCIHYRVFHKLPYA